MSTLFDSTVIDLEQSLDELWDNRMRTKNSGLQVRLATLDRWCVCSSRVIRNERGLKLAV